MLACTISQLSLPLTNAISVGGVPISSREGFLVQVRDPAGRVGVGECLPLPYFHKERFQHCLEQWSQLESNFQQYELDTASFDLRKPFLGIIPSPESSLNRPISSSPYPPFDLYPSLEFAIEQALLSLHLRHSSAIARQVFENDPKGQNHADFFGVPVNAVVIPDENALEQPEEIAKRIQQGGFRALKIKVGRFPIEKEIYFLRELTQTLGKSIELRLDGNRHFTPAGFQTFAHRLTQEISAGQIAPEQIEYIEEPLALVLNDTPSHFRSTAQEIYDSSPLPIALDESLPNFQQDLIQGGPLPRAVQAIVIKPTTLGGIHRTVQLMDACQKRGLKNILSSAFDSGWTIATYGFLARLAPPETAMGFDTYRFLAKDVLQEPLRFSGGKLWLPWDFWIKEKPSGC